MCSSNFIEKEGYKFVLCDVDWSELRIGYISKLSQAKLKEKKGIYNDSIETGDVIVYFLEPPENYDGIYVVESYMTDFFISEELKEDETLVFLPFYSSSTIEEEVNWQEVIEFIKTNIENDNP